MFRWTFRSRARHPLARLLGGVVAIAALVILLAFGLFAVAALAIGGVAVLVYNALRGAQRPVPATAGPANRPRIDDRVIEGEFKIVRDSEGHRQPQS